MNITQETNLELIKEPKNDTTEEKVFYVYHLIDPKNNLPFYVGKGKNDRMYAHENSVRNNHIPNKKNKLLYYKIKKVLKNSDKINYLKIQENLTEEESFLLETQEIKKYGRRNNRTGILCNMTDGGDGNQNIIFSKTTRKKLSLANKGRIITWGNKISKSLHRDKIILLERNIKISESNKGKIVSDETRKKQSVIHLGKKDSEQTKLKKSTSGKNRIYKESDLIRIRELGKNNEKIYSEKIVNDVKLFSILLDKPHNVYEVVNQIYPDLTYLGVRRILNRGEFKKT